MPLAVETIGAGETYTAIQAWEDALDATQQHTGQCKAEVFSMVVFQGITYTAANYPHLTAVVGAEHDGRAHEVSGAGNARVEYSGFQSAIVDLDDSYVRVSWLEVKAPGSNTGDCIRGGELGHYIHHNVCHNNHASSSGAQDAISLIETGAVLKAYRNIVYGVGASGIFPISGAAGSAILLNTIYEGNFSDSASDGGIKTNDTDYTIEANACFDNGTADILDTNGTLSNNATSDATATEGTNNLINQVTADQFVNPTTTWADTDLLLKAGADLIDAAETTYSTATYPEIDESIDARGVSITGTWDIGASQFSSAGPVTETEIITIDSLIQQTGITGSLTIDSMIQKSFTETLSIDALVAALKSGVITLDAFIQAAKTKTVTLDALIQATLTGDLTIDAFIQATQGQSTSIDALVQALITESVAVDALIQAKQTGQTSIDSFIQAANDATITLDAFIQSTQGQVVTLDALVQAVIIHALTIDAKIQKGFTEDAAIDALIQALKTGSSELDALLQSSKDQSATLDAFIQALINRDVSIDGIIAATKTSQVSIDAIIGAAFIIVTKIVSIDALIQASKARATSIDARIGVIDITARQILTASARDKLLSSVSRDKVHEAVKRDKLIKAKR